MSSAPDAVLLAAGLGSRLEPISAGLPKPLVPVGGRSILARSLDALARAGVEGLTVVVGHKGARVSEAALLAWPGATVVENPDPSRTGSMRSLALAWAHLGTTAAERILVVEGDVIFGPEAVAALCSAPGPDTVLASDATGAGDEVWILGQGTRILEISKSPSSGLEVLGELVGLSLLTRDTMEAMTASHFAEGDGALMEHYEERISAVSRTRPIRVHVERGLPWAEVDDAGQLARAEREVLPRLGST